MRIKQPQRTHLIDLSSRVNPQQVVKTGVQLLDRLQNADAGVQIQTMAVLYNLLCEHLGVDIRHELERANRVMRDADGFYKPEVRVLRAYIRGEL